MKKILAVVLVLVFGIVKAQTNVSGFISTNTTWTLAGSPYIVVGNILVMQNINLTIDPGVVVKFNDSTAIQINGELDAVGTPASRIIFTSNQTTPAAGDWGKIQFTNLSNGALFDANGNYLSGNVMQYCDVLYGGALGYGVIHVYNSSLYTSNCRINYSNAEGIECDGFVKIDSSSIRNCASTGLYMYSTASTYCSYTLQYDTLENNAGGGIWGELSVSGCPNGIVTINKNYFNHNSSRNTDGGGLFFSSDLQMDISENEFLNNSSQGRGGAIGIVGGGTGILISGNEFINDSSLAEAGAIYVEGGSVTIACNKFIHNLANNMSAIYLDKTENDTIRNNIFHGNKTFSNSSNCPVIFFEIDGGPTTEVFANNYLKSDTSSAILYLYGWTSGNDATHFYVTGNEFINDVTNAEISLYLNSNNSTLDFAHISGNNFLSPNAQYAIQNNVSFSGPSIDADSNYWNSSNTQHVDSSIYDFFDNGNLSVVYYSPILTAPVEIDTTCPPPIETFIPSEINNQEFAIFPNPTLGHFKIKDPQSSNCHLEIFNPLGEKIYSAILNEPEKEIELKHAATGIYFVKVSDGEKLYTQKLVIE